MGDGEGINLYPFIMKKGFLSMEKERAGKNWGWPISNSPGKNFQARAFND